jgi:hypothetical protein
VDDFVVNVKQIGNYPAATTVGATDVLLLQQGGLGGDYMSILASALVGTALSSGGTLKLSTTGGGVAWNGAAITSDGSQILVPTLTASGTISAPEVMVNGIAVADQDWVTSLFDALALNVVNTFNGRIGAVQLETDDVLRAGGAPIWNPHFGGTVTAPTPWDFRQADDTVATTAWVQLVLNQALCGGSVVTSFNGRGGAIILSTADVNAAYANFPNDLIAPTAPNPAAGDASNRIATTLFVDDGLADLQSLLPSLIDQELSSANFAPLNSPNFIGIPTAPTAATGVTSGQLATCAFVHNAVTAATTGVASFNTRTGAVVLTTADITGAGGAPLAAPTFTGNATSATPTPGDNSTRIATTAFVDAAIAAIPASAVTSFNTRTGAIVLNTTDITGAGGAPTASPALSGTPTAPTAAPGTATTQIASTAFVANAISSFSGGVVSFMGRTGAVSLIGNDISAAGGALLVGPAFTGIPTAPTATTGTNTTQLATCAFVEAALSSASGGVSSFNTRTGAITLLTSDITGAGGAPLASPNLSGVPTAPTAAQTSNDTTIATTAYVRAALAAAPGGVSSFNSRTGAVTFQAADISAVGGALLSSPALIGTPTAPTAVSTDSSTAIATTAFVAAKIAASGGVNSFNSRAGAVTLQTADVVGVSGALLTVAAAPPTGAPATANSALWWDSNGGNLFINYNDGTSTQWVAATSSDQAIPLSPTSQVFLSGSGTYTTPAGVRYIEVEMVGGGGGGGGAGNATAAASGGATTFGSLTAGGGSGATQSTGAAGGTASGGQVNILGGGGQGGVPSSAGVLAGIGGVGGSSFFSGGGASSYATVNPSANAPANSGGGGGGGASTNSGATVASGGGGGAGAYCRALIASPAASYPYSVGTGGTGATGTAAGGNGGSGVVIVKEHY